MNLKGKFQISPAFREFFSFAGEGNMRFLHSSGDFLRVVGAFGSSHL
jgi:hypothetical protein